MFFVYLKKKYPVVRLFSSFAHYEFTLNLFFQQCSINKILIFVILRKSFTVLLNVKIQIFRGGSLTCLLNYFFLQNCLKFLWLDRKKSAGFCKSNRSKFFEQLRRRCIKLGSFGNKQMLRIAGFFRSLPVLTYLCNKRLKPSIHCVQLCGKITRCGCWVNKMITLLTACLNLFFEILARALNCISKSARGNCVRPP